MNNFPPQICPNCDVEFVPKSRRKTKFCNYRCGVNYRGRLIRKMIKELTGLTDKEYYRQKRIKQYRRTHAAETHAPKLDNTNQAT